MVRVSPVHWARDDALDVVADGVHWGRDDAPDVAVAGEDSGFLGALFLFPGPLLLRSIV